MQRANAWRLRDSAGLQMPLKIACYGLSSGVTPMLWKSAEKEGCVCEVLLGAVQLRPTRVGRTRWRRGQ